MTIQGWRKLAMYAAAMIVIAFVELSVTNAQVLTTLIIVGLGTNGAVHMTRSLGDVLKERAKYSGGPDPTGTGRPETSND